jgi:hypothetical protein
MNLLKRYESDDFDESYAFEDAEYEEIEESGSSKPFLVKAIAMLLAVTGIAYGANIALSSGSNRLEFGQGFLTDGITVIPYAGFINDTGTGKFSLDSIILENIDKNCYGEDFTIQVYADTGDALIVSESATAANGASYVQFNLGRFYLQDSATVSAIDKSYIDYDILTDTSVLAETNANNQVQITFDPDRTLSFADAAQVRKITIQTVKHTP